MLSKAQNDLVTQTGPGTPGGEFMRRYWQPVALAEELPPGGAPIPVELLSEKLTLYRDEAEGYFLNESNPQAFVWVKMAEQSSPAATVAADIPDELDEPEFAPVEATLSYHEASRWMDGGERVDAVLLPDDLRPWLAAYVAQHYRPEPKKQRIRPPSFKGARRDER